MAQMRIVWLLLCALLVACASESSLTSSALAKIKIVEGMSRSEVEELVARALSRRSSYSPYGNNLHGGAVKYLDGDNVLEVTYKPGAPAPWALDPQGNAQHYPPADETVAAWRLYSKGWW